MATTIDHLGVDRIVKVLQTFTDAKGRAVPVGTTAMLTRLGQDWATQELIIEWDCAGRREELRFALRAVRGPRLGKMKEYFEVLGEKPDDRPSRLRLDPAERKMIVPPKTKEPAHDQWPDWAHDAKKLEDSGDLKAAEELIQKNVPHIGCAASIAEMYARQMRMFQRAGDEPRAIAAFKKAVDWMGSYAASATSGGEGEALSRERDDFQAALAREFGYDPTEPPPSR